MTIEALYNIYLKFPVVCTDTRKITSNCLFFALKGEHFDGNTFAMQALEQGSAYAIVDDEKQAGHPQILYVNDVLKTLQELAQHHREQLKIPVIGITGTNGKTTSKELAYAVLSQHYRTFATQGNLNNHIGVPLTLLSVNEDIEMAIVEMGANHPGEIEFLCNIAQPTHGVITNIGKAHLEGFGGFEGVKQTKGELYQWLKKNNGIAFVHGGDPTLDEVAKKYDLTDIIYYGSDAGYFAYGNLTAHHPHLTVRWHAQNGQASEAESRLTGTYNLENMLLAVCLGNYFELLPDEINAGLSQYEPKNNRSQLIHTTDNTIISDYYNANPSSMAVALDNLGHFGGKKLIILGDMFELGTEAPQEHEAVIRKAIQILQSECIFIGAHFYHFKDDYPGTFYRSTTEAYDALKAMEIKQATVLLKGSRSMKLEILVDLF